jgi:hypothetical protein
MQEYKIKEIRGFTKNVKLSNTLTDFATQEDIETYEKYGRNNGSKDVYGNRKEGEKSGICSSS